MKKDDKIKVETESGQMIDVTITSISPETIWVLVGDGPHASKCKLEPTRNQLAYAGSIMGRELIYSCSVEDVRQTLAEEAKGYLGKRWKR